MSEIALYNALTKLGLDHQAAKEAVTDVASSKDMATKSDIKNMATKSDITELKTDITELKADNKAIKWMLGLLLAINVAFIVSAVSLLIKFV